ncbi:MAG: DUF3579 domain-containing protein [Gammaproteobacteria bacterium]|nr:DUF3579 domain-containing protein [Gammaproteobacteria bacterium]
MNQPASLKEFVDYSMATPAHEPHKACLIQGINKAGKRFRPSDWAERLSSLHASFVGGRLQYSALLYPVVRNGIKCIQMSSQLKLEAPDIYAQVMEFAQDNDLNIIDSL